MVAPTARTTNTPDKDSLDVEFSDQNLFGFNHFPGIDRLEGGVRLNAALEGTWYLGGTTFDAFIGQSYRDTKSSVFPQYTGLHNQASDIVARVSFAPAPWLDVTYRTRLELDDVRDAHGGYDLYGRRAEAPPESGISTRPTIPTPCSTRRRRRRRRRIRLSSSHATR